jgi:putative peptidoglycan lipid II flippase
LGVFGVALATAIPHSLATFAAKRTMGLFRATLVFVLRLTELLTLPAAAGIIMLAEPINRLLFMWGRFGAADASAAAWATMAYALGICFAAFIKLLAPAFYAVEDSATPVKVAVAMVGLNLALAWWLMGPLRHTGLALAVSLTAAANAGLLYYGMRAKLKAMGEKQGFGLRAVSLPCAAATAAMLLLLWGMASCLRPLANLEESSRLVLAATVFGRITVAVGAYFFVLRALGVDLGNLWREARKQT